MKADIEIPKVENVYIVAIKEWSDDFMENIWNAYLINDSENELESVMVVSKAFGTIDGEMRKTSILRHAYIKVPANSSIKVELIENSLLKLNNEFMITYFIGDTLYDKNYIFEKNSINEKFQMNLPVLNKRGVMGV
jgi:hypothetical protein